MRLEAQIRHRQGDFTLETDFTLEGGLTALFGPSGSGKTTIVNVLAGLLRPDQAHIRFGGTVWNDTARGIFVPPHRRRIGYVFQDGRLFPHLSVRSNLLYGTRFQPVSAGPKDLARVVDLLGIVGLLERRPSMLSGGEKQRVALGRTLLSSPQLLLMDEPLSALDAARKAEILSDIERIRDEVGVPILYVSHAIGEVARLANTVIALRDGRIAASGEPGPVLSRHAARSGAIPPGSFLEARIERHMAKDGLSIAASRAGHLYLHHVPVPVGREVRLRIAADDIVLATARPEGISALNVLEGRVAAIEPTGGADVMVRLDCSGEEVLAKLTRYSAAKLTLEPGLAVFALFKAVSIDSEDMFRLGV